jgi:hypothetical protein
MREATGGEARPIGPVANEERLLQGLIETHFSGYTLRVP